MPSSGMLHGEAFVRTDVSEERRASIIMVIEALLSSKTSVLTKDSWCNIPENGIL
jgi:hypothetical protein